MTICDRNITRFCRPVHKILSWKYIYFRKDIKSMRASVDLHVTHDSTSPLTFLCFLCDTNKAIRKKQIVIRNEVNLIEENRNFGASLKWKRPNDTLVPQFQVISIISFLIYCTRKDESEQQKKTVAVFCRRLFNRMDRTDVAHKKPKRRKRFSSSFSFRVHWLMA